MGVISGREPRRSLPGTGLPGRGLGVGDPLRGEKVPALCEGRRWAVGMDAAGERQGLRDQPSLCSDVFFYVNTLPTMIYTMLPVIDKQAKGPGLGQLSAGSG